MLFREEHGVTARYLVHQKIKYTYLPVRASYASHPIWSMYAVDLTLKIIRVKNIRVDIFSRFVEPGITGCSAVAVRSSCRSPIGHLAAIFFETSQFADVTSIYTASKFIPEIEHRLNSDLVEVSSWLRKQKLHLNAIKCCVVLFGSRPALSQLLRLCVTLDGSDLLQIQKVKYLGVVFDSHLSWNDHIGGLRSKTNRIVKMLRRLRQFACASQSSSDTVFFFLFFCFLWKICCILKNTTGCTYK